MAAHGEAETEGFLDNYSMTRRTLDHAAEVLPIPKPLRVFVSLLSGLKNSRSFRDAGYVSPHNPITRRQAEAVRRSLSGRTIPEDPVYEVFPAFSATPPSVEEVVERTRGFDARILLSLSPVESHLTFGSFCDHLESVCTEEELAGSRVLSGFWRADDLREIYREHVFHHVPPDTAPGRPVLVLAFHGTLEADRKGDVPPFSTGLEETRSFASILGEAIAGDARNPFGEVVTAYLNHDVGGRWTQPPLESVLERLKTDGAGHAVLFPAGYFAEGNETLLRAKGLLEKSGIPRTTYIPCLNDSEAFCSFLAERAAAAARQILLPKEGGTGASVHGGGEAAQDA